MTRDGFGIWSGKECEVALRLSGRAAEQVPERLHQRTVRLSTTQGGDVLLKAKLRGWQELAWWILSWGRDIEVLSPSDLRKYVAEEHQAAARLYNGD